MPKIPIDLDALRTAVAGELRASFPHQPNIRDAAVTAVARILDALVPLESDASLRDRCTAQVAMHAGHGLDCLAAQMGLKRRGLPEEIVGVLVPPGCGRRVGENCECTGMRMRPCVPAGGFWPAKGG